jgi:hypothetical protein
MKVYKLGLQDTLACYYWYLHGHKSVRCTHSLCRRVDSSTITKLNELCFQGMVSALVGAYQWNSKLHRLPQHNTGTNQPIPYDLKSIFWSFVMSNVGMDAQYHIHLETRGTDSRLVTSWKSSSMLTLSL